MRKPLPPLSEAAPQSDDRRDTLAAAAMQHAEPDFLGRLRIVYPRTPGRVELHLKGKWRRMWVM